MTNDTSEILETLKGQPTKLVDAAGHNVYPDLSRWGTEWFCSVFRCRADASAFLHPPFKHDYEHTLAFEVYDDEE